VVDLDIRAFFDTIPHSLLLKAVARHTDSCWVLVYIERWLKAPLQQRGGVFASRDTGTPQGSAISPLLANIFLHYAFDRWMTGTFPATKFERYADDAVVHCVSEAEALTVRAAIAQRFERVGLELHPDKTCLVYCKDSNRTGSAEHERCDFLGFTFAPRAATNKAGGTFVSFSPAASNVVLKAFRQKIRRWRLHRWVSADLRDLAGRDQPGGPRLGQLLRAVLPLEAVPNPVSHQRVPHPLPQREIQAVAPPTRPSTQVASCRGSTGTSPLCALEARRAVVAG
jgi:RNA-directed DNA polymerase